MVDHFIALSLRMWVQEPDCLSVDAGPGQVTLGKNILTSLCLRHLIYKSEVDNSTQRIE